MDKDKDSQGCYQLVVGKGNQGPVLEEEDNLKKVGKSTLGLEAGKEEEVGGRQHCPVEVEAVAVEEDKDSLVAGYYLLI